MVDCAHDVRRGYIQSVLNVPVAKQNIYIAAMEKYGSEHWWASDDPVKIAKYQINESLLLVPFIKFQDSLAIVLKRHVSASEIAYNNAALRAEVEAATV